MITYFIKNSLNGFIKIGRTVNVEKRLSALVAATGYESLEIIQTFNGDCERKFHEYFSEYRQKGEWFNIPADYIEDIGKVHSKFTNLPFNALVMPDFGHEPKNFLFACQQFKPLTEWVYKFKERETQKRFDYLFNGFIKECEGITELIIYEHNIFCPKTCITIEILTPTTSKAFVQYALGNLEIFYTNKPKELLKIEIK